MKRTLDCLIGYAAKLRAYGGDPAETIAVATSQARDSKDAPEFFAKIEKETGFKFKVISGDEEARLTFIGALLPGMSPARSAVIDIGGGSTEIIMGAAGSTYGAGGKITSDVGSDKSEQAASGAGSNTSGRSAALRTVGQSVDIGSVRYTERFLKSDPVTDDEFWACQDAIDAEVAKLREARGKAPSDVELVAVAGTATTLAAIHLGLPEFDAAKLDGAILTRGDVHRLVEDLKWRSVAERMRLAGLEEKRADVILAGALILWRAMEVLGFVELKVSTRGLRFGVLASGS
jgi:exopolyphosphatase/guanosine-5'-triphosphate,3'-diphosphate pyrophosphatase